MREGKSPIAIVGGGIGGLAAALSLLHAGLDVQVYEQAPALGEVGAGIQISPNASRLLHRLGLGPALDRTGVRPVGVHQRRWDDGRTLQWAPLGEAMEAAFGAPYYHFHRADLLRALAEALPAERVQLDHRLISFQDQGDRVELTFANGARAAASVLVGADGIHSTVRAALFGSERPRFTGCTAYRGLVPVERLAHLGLEVAAHNWMGPGGHFVHYFVAGGRLMNFVAIKERETWTRESWTDRGEVAEALATFEGWHPTVRAIIGGADETFLWALFDRLPLARWSVGRVTLLGDACHAMLPFMAQGAAQAIEDGATLAGCLSQVDAREVPAALQRYESLRLPRASRIQGLSAGNKTRFHIPDGPAQEERDAEMARGTTDWSRSAWLYGHDSSVLEPAL